MKNLNMTISSVMSPQPLAQLPLAQSQNKTTVVSFSVYFDSEMEAIEFTTSMLEHMKEFK